MSFALFSFTEFYPKTLAQVSNICQNEDALESKLRKLVRAGQLDLKTAQSEIASNWIEAYKKYIRTSLPLQYYERPQKVITERVFRFDTTRRL